MYTGEVQVREDSTVAALLSAADILRVRDLKQVCFQYLNDTLSSGNALARWRLAEKYKKTELADKCRTIAVNEFTKFNSPSNLRMITEDMMEALLSSDELNVQSESTVCDILVNWLQVHSDDGSAPAMRPERMLRFIRWSGVSEDYIKTKLNQNKILINDAACRELLIKVMTYLESNQCQQFEGLLTHHRPSTRLENSLVTFGSDSGAQTSSEVCRISLQRTDDVMTLSSIPTLNLSNESAAAYCFNDTTVYVTGAGVAPYKKTWKLHTQKGWEACADMRIGRQAHCVAAINSMLYVLGGWSGEDNEILRNVERYNTNTDTWSSACDLRYAVDSAACVTYRKKIYMFGGEDSNLEPLSAVQVYTPGQLGWRLMDTPMPRGCAEIRAIMWETSVLLFSCTTCFIYNFETKIWQERQQYRTNTGGFAATLDNNTVFIAGGGSLQGGGGGDEDDDEPIWTCSRDVRSVSVLDVVNDRLAVWSQHAQLRNPSVTRAYVLLSLDLGKQIRDNLSVINTSLS